MTNIIFTNPEYRELAFRRKGSRSLHPSDQQVRKMDGCMVKVGALKYMTADGYILKAAVIERPEKQIVCFPSWIGCPLSCPMCASGRSKTVRPLQTFEMLDICKAVPHVAGKPTLYSCMGDGEPMATSSSKYSVMIALAEMSHWGKVALSTTVPLESVAMQEIPNLVASGVKVQVSLHSAVWRTRKYMIPGSINPYQIVGALGCTPVEMNVTLVPGVNDNTGEAAVLVQLLRGTPHIVKLTNYNGPSRVHPCVRSEFAAVLTDGGVSVELYDHDGSDAGVSCGQLTYEKILD